MYQQGGYMQKKQMSYYSSQPDIDEESYGLYSLKDISFEDNCRSIFKCCYCFSERDDVWFWGQYWALPRDCQIDGWFGKGLYYEFGKYFVFRAIFVDSSFDGHR